ELLRAQDRMARDGLRVLAFAYRCVGSVEEARESGLTLCGLAGIEDPPRPEVAPAVARCHEAGIRVIMVTGDHPSTALAIGREIGLVRGKTPAVIRGEQMAAMSQTELQLALDAPEILFARVSAEQKMQIVKALQAKGHVVAATGDGVNDGPALKAADIGIAMGIAGTDVAREAADMVLLDDNFASIVAAVEEGRAVFENIRKFLTYILTSNVPEMVPFLAFALLKIPLPLTVIQVLIVDLGTDMLPALALGAERPHPGLMRAGRDGSDRRHAGVHPCAGPRRHVLRRYSGRHRPTLSAGHHRHPGGDRGGAGGECLQLPAPPRIGLQLQPVRQPLAAVSPSSSPSPTRPGPTSCSTPRRWSRSRGW
ncbi:MAG: ATPase, P-type (transporting), superfamily, subfamily, partial [Proteobacteria bacterium]|nr:ATPase, P-type (transporting), superfamily, subfamily [Pseudomonadota bacterium]